MLICLRKNTENTETESESKSEDYDKRRQIMRLMWWRQQALGKGRGRALAQWVVAVPFAGSAFMV